MKCTFDAELWLHDGDAPWVFITVPRDISDEIADATEWSSTGFGSVKVDVTIGDTDWSTSLFPSKPRRAYVLPVKKAVRDREKVDVGDVATVFLVVDT